MFERLLRLKRIQASWELAPIVWLGGVCCVGKSTLSDLPIAFTGLDTLASKIWSKRP